MSNSDFATKQLQQVRNRIAEAADSAARNADAITLIGASKLQSAELIQAFNGAGLIDVGENYLNEALEKQTLLQQSEQADRPLNWHFIGRLQSNKSKKIAANFSWVHGVSSLSVAQKLSKYAVIDRELNILVQINIDQEDSKAGVNPDLAPALCAQIGELANISLRGFMAMPKATQVLDQQRRPFAACRKLLELSNQRYGLGMDTLSMGMSGDLEAAILEGSTLVRVGTDLFGSRV